MGGRVLDATILSATSSTLSTEPSRPRWCTTITSTLLAPLSLRALATFATVPPVLSTSSTTSAALPSREPGGTPTSISPVYLSLLFSTHQRGAPRTSATCLALSTPPASGDITATSLHSPLFAMNRRGLRWITLPGK
ncbi:MAG: hypothetical protein NZ902_00530 [Acidilobaceae archaeon]|nr:hypothetical protein [Acidilobaceae archaeon]MCX8165319.1 hypothetical protein [Acidilobaceae archaeon]MDW7973745.1 hypothetical protein [Sulfolobales archaeon]